VADNVSNAIAWRIICQRLAVATPAVFSDPRVNRDRMVGTTRKKLGSPTRSPKRGAANLSKGVERLEKSVGRCVHDVVTSSGQSRTTGGDPGRFDKKLKDMETVVKALKRDAIALVRAKREEARITKAKPVVKRKRVVPKRPAPDLAGGDSADVVRKRATETAEVEEGRLSPYLGLVPKSVRQTARRGCIDRMPAGMGPVVSSEQGIKNCWSVQQASGDTRGVLMPRSVLQHSGDVTSSIPLTFGFE
jgi:hypothetical protein